VRSHRRRQYARVRVRVAFSKSGLGNDNVLPEIDLSSDLLGYRLVVASHHLDVDAHGTFVAIVSAQSSRGGSNNGKSRGSATCRSRRCERHPAFETPLPASWSTSVAIARRSSSSGAQRSAITCGAPLATLKRLPPVFDLRLRALRHRVKRLKRLDLVSIEAFAGRSGRENCRIDRVRRVAPRRQNRCQ